MKSEDSDLADAPSGADVGAGVGGCVGAGAILASGIGKVGQHTWKYD